MRDQQLVLFGRGPIAQIARDYFNDDSDYSVVAFTIDDEFIEDGEVEYEGLPIVPFSQIEARYPSDQYSMHIALSYTDLNRLRERKYHEAKAKGYQLANYISSRCSYLSKIPCGDNCFIFEDNTIQPYVTMKNNIILWSGNHIGHHSVIESHNFISSHVVISGFCRIQPHCFLGVNSTVAHKVEIAEGTIVGAGAVISKNTEAFGVYVPARSVKLQKRSDEIKL